MATDIMLLPANSGDMPIRGSGMMVEQSSEPSKKTFVDTHKEPLFYTRFTS